MDQTMGGDGTDTLAAETNRTCGTLQAKARPTNTALEYSELMTKDQNLDVVVPILGRAACERDEPAQKYVEDSEEHGTRLLRNGGPTLRTYRSHWRSEVSVPFTARQQPVMPPSGL